MRVKMQKDKVSKQLAVALGAMASRLVGESALMGGTRRLKREYPQLPLRGCKRLAEEYLEAEDRE